MRDLPLFPDLNVISFTAKPSRKRRARQPSGEVRPYPLCRRIVMIRRLAAELEQRSGEFRDGFWFDAIGALEEQLSSFGIAEEEILSELRKFRSAVQFEIDALAQRSSRQGGDAA